MKIGLIFGDAISTMSTMLKKYIWASAALVVLILANMAFAEDTTKIKDQWDKFDILAKLLVSFVAAAVPSLIAWQIYRYNKRQAAEDAARRDHEQAIQGEQWQRDREIRRLETVQRFMPQLMSEQLEEKFAALALIKTLGDKEFVDQITEAVVRGFVDREDRGAIEQLRTNPNPTIADMASEAIDNVYLSSGSREQPDITPAPVEATYYEEISDKIVLDEGIRYDDDISEHFGDFVVTRGSHVLEIPVAFRVGIYLVSNEFYKKFVADGGYDVPEYWRNAGDRRSYRTSDGTPGPGPWPSRTTISPGLERHPVSGVCFYEATAFVLWLQKMHPPAEPGWRWILPTEDMWEFAARSNDGRLYPWGSTWEPDRCNSREANVNSTTQISQYPLGQSAFGCFDMAGNLWEFVEAEDKYPDTCILRGGSFRNSSLEVRNHLRLIHVPKGHRPPDFGFRVAQIVGYS